MKKLLAIAAVAIGIAMAPIAAGAGERAGDAVLGGVAGLVVGGPVLMVVGGVVGYTAGPEIARGLGLKPHKRKVRRAKK